MATIYEMLFLLVLVGCTLITLMKLYNIYNYFYTDEINSLFSCILLFVGYVVLWFFGLITLLDNTSTLLYIMGFRLISLMLLTNLALFIIELFCCMGWAAQRTYTGPYNASKERAKLLQGR